MLPNPEMQESRKGLSPWLVWVLWLGPTVLGCGIVPPVPFIVAAIIKRSKYWIVSAATLTGAWALVIVVLGVLSPQVEDSGASTGASPMGATAYLLFMAASTIMAIISAAKWLGERIRHNRGARLISPALP